MVVVLLLAGAVRKLLAPIAALVEGVSRRKMSRFFLNEDGEDVVHHFTETPEAERQRHIYRVN